jgi:hypothetical protein
MEGHLIYTINGIERKMFFGNYALEETLSHFDSSISDISVLLDKKLLPFMRVFIYHSAAYIMLKDGKEPDFNQFDVHEWIDNTGGSGGDFILKASKELFRCLGLNEVTDQSEKKKTNRKAKLA